MPEFVENGARMVTEYLMAIGISPESLPALKFVASGQTAQSQCVDVNGNEIQNDRSNDYCPTDNAVYIGQSTLWDSYRHYGQAAPISGLAHEYGHFLQSVMRVPSPGSATETIRHEDQADCFSGAFMGFLRDRGSIRSQEDVDAVERYLTATASDDAPGRDHGTAAERIDSFTLGYAGGLPTCSRFFPSTPLTR
jgi:predicted metalloprotease